MYSSAANLKNYLYDQQILTAENCGRPVISIGNLTMGGTGKTPVVDYCLRLLIAKGHRPGIVCRSYRGSAKAPGSVDAQHPEIFGDEACWYAGRHPGIPVWSGPRKVDTARALVRNADVDVILVDDGFQHRKLHRQVDLLLLDATDGPAAYECVPMGRARESFVHRRRATAICLTKSNLVPENSLQELRERVGLGVPIFEFRSRLTPREIPSQGSVLLVSGIARPESFRVMVDELLPQRRKASLSFGDHHGYTVKDVEVIEAVAKRNQAEAVLVTEKDAVKLMPLWRSNLPLLPLSLEVDLKGSVESFYEVLRGAFR